MPIPQIEDIAMALKPGESPRNTRGDACRILSVTPLTEADLPALREKSAPIARLKSIRDSHHRVARMMASGATNAEIADSLGYSRVRVSQWRNDPAMQDLVAHYRDMITEVWKESQDVLAEMSLSAMSKAVRTINDHFDEADERDELIPLNSALKVASDLMDRFGYGKKSATLNVNLDYAAQLEAAIARSRAPKTLEAE